MTSTETMDVLRVEGVVRLSYPLRQLHRRQAAVAAGTGVYTMGDGPCGAVAQQVLTLQVETPSSFEPRAVFLYDVWAERLQFLQRECKVRIQGLGLVTSLWDIGGEDTEDPQPCFVVAEKHLLQQALKHRPGAFELPRALSIAVTYEVAQKLAGQDQIHHLAPVTLHSRDLRTAPKDEAQDPPAKPSRQAARGKRALQTASSTYMYTCLGDLVYGNAYIYGVVVNMSLPKRTNGRDKSMTVHVVDESCPERRHALLIVIFFPTIEQMPKVLYVGDVIRFHKLEIKRYQDNFQGVSRPMFTRYLVIREDTLTGELQQVTCSENWTFSEADAVRVRELLSWSKQGLRDDKSFLPGYPQAPMLLSDAVFVESSCAKALQANSVDVPAYGVLREIVFDSCWELLQTFGFTEELLLRHWCRFRNLLVADEAEPGLIAPDTVNSTVLRFREGSSVLFVPDFVQDVRDRVEAAASASLPSALKQEREREESSGAAAPQAIATRTVVPELIRRDVPVTTLRDVVRSEVVPRKFHCLARLVRLWPSDVTKLTKPQPGTDSFVYSFVVRLEDATDSIDVIVYGKDAEHFLHGIPPCDLNTSSSSRIVLEKRLAALLDSQHLHHCCVKSYSPPTTTSSPSSSSNKAPSVRYRLFDTLLQ